MPKQGIYSDINSVSPLHKIDVRWLISFTVLDSLTMRKISYLSSSEVMTVYLKMQGTLLWASHWVQIMGIWATLFQFSCFFLTLSKNPPVFWRLLPCPNTLNNIKISINSWSCVLFLSSRGNGLFIWILSPRTKLMCMLGYNA